MNARIRYAAIAATAFLALAASARADVQTAQEQFFGHGTRGPYAISRQNVEDRSTTVLRNGLHLQSGTDYLFDAGMGAMSFSEPLGRADIVEVQYSYDTAKAHAATASTGTLGLISRDGGGLALSYGFKPDAGGNQQLTGLGFSGQAMIGSSHFTSAFMVDKTAANAGTDAQNLQLDLKHDTGRFQFDAGMSRVGSQFGQADALKLVKGSQAMNFTGSLQLSPHALLTTKELQTETPDAAGVKRSSLLTSGLSADVAPGTHVTALHEQKSDAQGANTVTSQTDRLQLDQKLGDKTTATLVAESLSNAKNGDGDTVHATRFNLATSGDHGLAISSALSLADSSKTGSTRDAALKLAEGDGSLKLTMAVTDHQATGSNQMTHAMSLESSQKDGLKMTLNVAGDSGDKGAHEHAGFALAGGNTDKLKFAAAVTGDGGDAKGTGSTFSLDSKPTGTMHFAASRQDSHADGGDASSTKVGMDLSANGGVKIAAAYTGDQNDKGDTSAATLKFEAKPMDALKLTASMADGQDAKGANQATNVSVEAKPNQALQVAASYAGATDVTGQTETSKVSVAANGGALVNVTAAYGNAQASTGDTAVKEATMRLTPVKDKLSVSGSYRDETKGTTDTQVAMFQADVKPLEAIAVSGYYKSRDTGAPDQINTMDTHVTFKPATGIQMVGSYATNPEDKDVVLRLVRKGLTLQSNVGCLSFSGGYVTEQSLLDDAQGARAEFKLGLKFHNLGTLQGGFEQTVGPVHGYTPMLAYNVNYTHSVGSDFHVLLDANVTQHDASVSAAQRQEVKATANLGLRF